MSDVNDGTQQKDDGMDEKPSKFKDLEPGLDLSTDDLDKIVGGRNQSIEGQHVSSSMVGNSYDFD